MLKIEGQAFQKCSGGTRRNFLQIGAPLLGLGLADLLRLESGGEGSVHTSPAMNSMRIDARDRILINAGGGLIWAIKIVINISFI